MNIDQQAIHQSKTVVGWAISEYSPVTASTNLAWTGINSSLAGETILCTSVQSEWERVARDLVSNHQGAGLPEVHVRRSM